MNAKAISAIIVTWNTTEYAINVIRDLLSVNACHEIIVIDNNSPMGDGLALAETFESEPRVKVHIATKNLGFGRACNVGAKMACSEYLLFINPDIKLVEDAIDKLLVFITNDSNVGLVGPKILNEDGSLQPSACRKITPWTVFFGGAILERVARLVGFRPQIVGHVYTSSAHTEVIYPDWVLGACMLMPRWLFADIGGFDERFFMYCEELDLCLRVKARGFKIAYNPAAVVVHYGGKAAEQVPRETVRRRIASEYIFLEKYYGVIIARASVLLNGFGSLLKALVFLPCVGFAFGRHRARSYLRLFGGYMWLAMKLAYKGVTVK